MSWFNKYEKRAFMFLIGGFLWSIAWLFATWSYTHWFEILYESIFMNVCGVIFLAGYIWFMINMVLNLIIGQWKLISASSHGGTHGK